MSNIVRDINIKNEHTTFSWYFINIEDFHPNITEIGEKPYKNILIYYIAYVKIKDSKSEKINRVNPSYFMFNKMNGYFNEINENKYLTLVPTNESRDKVKSMKNYELKSEI